MWKIGDKWINSRIGGSDSSTPLSHGGGQSSCLLFLGHLLGSEDGIISGSLSVFPYPMKHI